MISEAGILHEVADSAEEASEAVVSEASAALEEVHSAEVELAAAGNPC